MITRVEAAAHADHVRLLDGLNPEQREAVQRTDGPVLVLAGAGSGKTRVITRRIAYLLSRGVPPRSVLAVTFTNKAAREMRERVGDLVGRAAAKELTVSTFHSFCVRVLRRHAEAAGLSPTFTICDESDQLSAVKGALRELRIAETAVHPKAALGKVSLFKNRLVTADQALAEAVDDHDELVAKVYRAYDAHLRRSRTVDFDDLLLLARRLLAERAEIRAELQDRYRYLLVDEYQDTNGVQYEILRLLAGERRNLFVVGDDDQSIYGWRGADIRKILGFNRDFPEAHVIRLETNYRSTPEILEAANKVIRNNPARHDKTLRPAVGPGEPIRVFETDDEEHEAAFVVDEISRETRTGRARFGDYAILFRTAVQPRVFEMRLRTARIPYELVGGMSFFDRKEVRDLVAYLRLAANPHDEPSLLRVINVPPRGVGKTSIDRIVEAATREGRSAAEILDGPPVEGVTAETRASITRFRERLGAVAPRVAEAGLTTALRELVVAIDYKAEIDRCYPDALTRQARWAAVEEIVNLAENHERRTPGATLASFLEEVALSSEEREEDSKAASDRVTLMTLHAAKGLEFPRVYLVGVEEGLLPHARAVAENTVEEERRLMYVGITRAQRNLTISFASSRRKYGEGFDCEPSRFLSELPESDLRWEGGGV
ncbi:MAG TPA: UvrD-helicase domain-containing protein, partial [Planctomycetota bacterium]|nr:UvrD-helicase domain-containing protein [Planctomycetota bacterium]